MESTKLIEVLGLAEDATEETILAALTELRAKAEAVKAKADDDGDAITTLRSDLAEAQKRIVSLENERASEKARKDVDDVIKARKFAPASRDTLIKMAVGNPVEFGELVKATPENAILAKTGEVGSDGDGEEMELTELELQVGTKMGLSKEELLASKKLEVK